MAYGTAIPQNADLNDYQNVGNYYCSTATTAATISNMPSSSNGFNTGFTMKVELASGTAYPCQTIRAYNTGNIAFRMKWPEGEWSAWRYILTTTE